MRLTEDFADTHPYLAEVIETGLINSCSYLSGQAFTIMLVYVWARRNPFVRMNFFGLVTFQAPYLPWVLLGFSLLIGNSVSVDLVRFLTRYWFGAILFLPVNTGLVTGLATPPPTPTPLKIILKFFAKLGLPRKQSFNFTVVFLPE